MKKYTAYLYGADTCGYSDKRTTFEVNSQDEAEQWCTDHSFMGGYDWSVEYLVDNETGRRVK